MGYLILLAFIIPIGTLIYSYFAIREIEGKICKIDDNLSELRKLTKELTGGSRE